MATGKKLKATRVADVREHALFAFISQLPSSESKATALLDTFNLAGHVNLATNLRVAQTDLETFYRDHRRQAESLEALKRFMVWHVGFLKQKETVYPLNSPSYLDADDHRLLAVSSLSEYIPNILHPH